MTLTLNDALEFDIDVDVSALIGAGLNDVLVDSRYYVRAKQPQTRLAAHELRVLDDDLDVPGALRLIDEAAAADRDVGEAAALLGIDLLPGSAMSTSSD